MATKGLSYFVAGKYGVSQGAVAYTEGKVLGKAISYTVSLDEPTANNLYADNEIAESDTQVFTTGNIQLNSAEFLPEIKAWMYGQTPASVTVGTNNTVDVYKYGDGMNPIYFGVGFIEMKQINNVDKFQAVTLQRVKARMPGRTANTKGETIEWQTPTITCDIYRDETEERNWMTESDLFDTEAEAKAYLNSVFSVKP